MELIIRSDLLAGRARRIAEGDSPVFDVACALGPPLAREPVLLARAPWNPLTPPPPVRLSIQQAPYRIRRPRSWQYLAQHLSPPPGTGRSGWEAGKSAESLWASSTSRAGRRRSPCCG